MTRSTLAALPLAALAVFALTPPAAAQESTTRGLNLGFHLASSALKLEDGDDESTGGGAGIVVGYGLNRTVMLLFQLDGILFDVEDADVEGEWTMGHADLGVRFHFASTLRKWVPYLQVAATGRAVTVNDAQVGNDTDAEVTFSGGGLSGGGGLMVYLKETLALDLQLMLTGGQFTDVKVDNVTVSGLEIDATSSRLSLGLSWWP